jgi:hypothetical protein
MEYENTVYNMGCIVTVVDEVAMMAKAKKPWEVITTLGLMELERHTTVLLRPIVHVTVTSEKNYSVLFALNQKKIYRPSRSNFFPKS